jgi:hypothetical protein
MTDTNRFPDGPPVSEAYRERPNGTLKKMPHAPGVSRDAADPIVEYHNRLQEYIRLALVRKVDAEILADHAQALDSWRARHDSAINKPFTPEKAFARQHFPDIPELERQVEQLRGGPDAQPRGPVTPPRFDEGASPMRKSAEPGPPAHPVEGDRIPHQLIPVDPSPIDRLAEVPEAVADTINRHVTELLTGQPAGVTDLPHRATWNSADATVTVHYPDGLDVRVVLQVNSDLPPGHPIVVRPPVEFVDGAWRQTEPGGVVLPAHAPVDPAARATYVHYELDNAWR